MSHPFSVSLRTILLISLIGICLSLPGLPTVQAAGNPTPFKVLGSHKLGPPSHHSSTSVKDGGACDPQHCGTPPLLQKGGPVIHDPQVYLVFWGSWWISNAETSSGIVPGMQGLFYQLAGGQYNNILSQYTDDGGAPNNFIHNDVHWVTSWTDTGVPPPASLTMAAIGQETLNAMAANHWPNTPNTMVMVFPQPGTTYDYSFDTPGDITCGEHDWGTAYGGTTAYVVFGMVRYTLDQPACNYGSGSATGDMQEVASHEYAEMATDPEPTGINNGWETSDGSEIADLCNWGAQSYSPTNASQLTIFVTELWDNSAKSSQYPNGQCMLQHGQEYPSPDTTSPFNGKHTVQGAILDHYQQIGGVNSSLREPTSEQAPVAGGYVSYFQGPSCGSQSCGAIYQYTSTGVHEVAGAIYAEYINIGGPTSSVYGFPVSDIVAAGSGEANYFGTGGSGLYGSKAGIYWSSSTGAHGVAGGIYSEYINIGGLTSSVYGLPVSDQVTTGSGEANYFGTGGSGPYGSKAGIYWSSSTGAHGVAGGIYSEYVNIGGPTSSVYGLPVSDQVTAGSGEANYFGTGGSGPYGSKAGIYWSSSTGAHGVAGGIYSEYINIGGLTSSVYGLPVSDQVTAGGGEASYFGTGGSGPYGSKAGIYWSSGTGAHGVAGGIYAKYILSGGPTGQLGLPVSDQYVNSSGYEENDFIFGTIVWENGTAVVTYYSGGCAVMGDTTGPANCEA